ncbi:hypothetical protein [Shewanella sp. GXUN23E]|uniref:hypothetical protein n=1 Tax=Shewanella sp. GXUN23E TaxID=3422498 RepID=UPI003D7DF32A
MSVIDIPFEYRHLCWFCGEPGSTSFNFKAGKNSPHPSLKLPCCTECHALAVKAPATSVWECLSGVKDALIKRYAKHLAIGDNWTREELEASGFSCRILSGFRESGWMMYEIARDRVNFSPWPLSLDGIALDEHRATLFAFNGLSFGSVGKARDYYQALYGLDREFFTSLINLLGQPRFGYALKLARLYRTSGARDKQRVLRELAEDAR